MALFSLLLGVVGLVACGRSAALRAHTYPPDFRYLERKDVHAAMGELTDAVIALNAALRGGEPVDRDHVVELLGQLHGSVQSLGAPGSRSNHPLIDANLELLRQDVERARLAAQANPPNYYLAGSVSGACFYCHH